MNNVKDEVIKWIDNKEGELIQFAKDLISIPTISTLPNANERYEEINTYFAEKFDEIGLKEHSEYKNGDSGAPNFICTMKGYEEGKRLAIGGHSDVVAANEKDWITESGFKPEVIDGRLYGRGAADMKCGLAAAYMAIRAIKENKIKLKGDLIFVSSVDEEVGGINGMKFLAESGILKTDYLINAEQTNMNVMTAYKGTCYIEVTIEGSAAHGSTPHLGVNAIEKAAKVIGILRNLGLEWNEDARLGSSTINFGLINGGTAKNVVADKCSFTLDIRMVSGQTAEKVLENVQSILNKIVRNDQTFKATANFISRYTAPVLIPDSDTLVKTLKSNGQIVGHNLNNCSFISPGDCWHFLKDGISALMCGPGCIDDVHKSNEFSHISEIILATKIYALSAIDLCELL